MNCRRIAHCLIVALGVAVAPGGAAAQGGNKVHRTALVFCSTPVSEMAGPAPANRLARLFVEALRDLGYAEGRNLILERRSLEGKFDLAAEIANDLVLQKTDVIVSGCNAMTQAAMGATRTIPIVMAGNSAPVENRLVTSLARPGGNVTGLSNDLGAAVEGKRLELLKEAVPRISRVAFLGHASTWNHPTGQQLRATAQRLGLTLTLAETQGNDVAAALAAVSRERADAIFASANTTNYVFRRMIVKFAATYRLPATFQVRDAVEDGGLMSYGLNVSDLYRGAATYVDRILRGARPADLPVEQPSRFDFMINLKTARALGITIPESVLLRADEVLR